MILSKLAGAALIISVAAGPTIEPDGANVRLSLQQKNAAVQALMRSATECIARTVAADPRFRKQAPHTELGDLIVASVPSCVGPVRAMIDAYDRYLRRRHRRGVLHGALSRRAAGGGEHAGGRSHGIDVRLLRDDVHHPHGHGIDQERADFSPPCTSRVFAAGTSARMASGRM